MSERTRMIVLAILASIPVLFLATFIPYIRIWVPNRHAGDFSAKLMEMVDGQREFHMEEITDFDWDRMVVFGPYTSRGEMEERAGAKWTVHSYFGYYIIQKTALADLDLMDDAANKLIFMKGNKVVLDVTFFRKKVDLTHLKTTIPREEARFRAEGRALKQMTD